MSDSPQYFSSSQLRLFQRTGNRPLTLMGGGPTKIGDPSDKNEARPLLTDEIIANNMAGIRGIFTKFLSYDDSATGAIMANNADWLGGLKYIDFLRDVGRHFSVNAMTKMDFVKRRLDNEQNLSFLEFNYMIIQGYDFLELSRRNDVALQMGGSDQWGNIVQGIELGRRIDGKELFGLTVPLLATASGQKMGKSAGGAVWLNEDRLNNFDYYQFWRNTEDADVGRFLKLFTELPIEQCDELGAAQGAAMAPLTIAQHSPRRVAICCCGLKPTAAIKLTAAIALPEMRTASLHAADLEPKDW